MGLYQNQNEDINGNVYSNTLDGFGNKITSTTVSLKQALDVNIVNSTSGDSVQDKTAFTYGTSMFVPVGGVYNDTAASVPSGDQAAARITQFRAVHVNLRDSSGNEEGLMANPLFVRGTDGTNAQGYTAASAALVSDTIAEASLASIDGKLSPASGGMFPQIITGSSQSLLAANASRKGFSVYNDSNGPAWIAVGPTASSGQFVFEMFPKGYWEGPSWVYTGQISGLGAGTGAFQVTEYV